MPKMKMDARVAYEAAVQELQKFCEENTDFEVHILDGVYPIRIQFIPDQQFSLFGNENITEDGEICDLIVTLGLETAVTSTLKFRMDAAILRKMIKKAEKVGYTYYHAFRQERDMI
jgi:hypothetical protein